MVSSLNEMKNVDKQLLSSVSKVTEMSYQKLFSSLNFRAIFEKQLYSYQIFRAYSMPKGWSYVNEQPIPNTLS